MTKSEEKGYEDLIYNLISLGVDIFPDNYSFIRYYPPLEELPETQSSKDRQINLNNIKGKLVLFVYIPFCAYGCSFCFYSKRINASQKIVERYLDSLEKEARFYSRTLGSYEINSIYVGGGTPSYLSIEQMDRLFNILNTNFNIANADSFTFETSPETLDREKLTALINRRVKRISMGIQSLDDKVLANAGRKYTSKEAIGKIRMLKENVSSFNLDFIFGLDDQTIDDVINYLDLIKEIQPPSVTFYQRWRSMKDKFISGREIKRDFSALHETLGVRELITETMKGAGYSMESLFRFVKKSADGCAYCKAVWEDNSCLALGLSAYSYVNGLCFQNVGNFRTYQDLIDENVLPIHRKKVLTDQEKSTRALVLGLKTAGLTGIDASLIERRYGVALSFGARQLINELASVGALAKEGGGVSFTRKGMAFAENILLRLIKEDLFY